MSSFYSFNVTMLFFSTLQGVFAPGSERAPNLFDPVLLRLRQWRERQRSRRELASFDEYQLRDIGLSASQASFESGKSFLCA